MDDPVAAERLQVLTEGERLDAERTRRRFFRRTATPGPLQRRELWDRYSRLLPEVTVARCPQQDSLVRWPIDTYGLDGWFWRYRSSARRAPESLPSTWLAMAGAMRIQPPVEDLPYVAMPGPDVPYVVPKMLATPGVRAVIAEVPVGGHTGWAITYFGPREDVPMLVNLWGTDSYPVRGHEWATWGATMPWLPDYDFDLRPWLDSGSLLWIEPGDTSSALRSGADGCPFVDLPGERQLVVTFKGQVWHVTAFAGPAGENNR